MKDKFNLSKEQNIFLAKKILVSSIYNAAKLEGLNVTFPETQTILNGVNVPSVALDEIECIINLRNAWKYVLNSINCEFTLAYVSRINEDVSRNESLAWGELRSGQVGISGTDYLPPIPKKEDVSRKISEILSLPTITEQAISYFLYGIYSQLFWDGNKRTSCIVANKLLISNGKGILTVKEEHILNFNQLLLSYYNEGDDSKLKAFLYENCIYGLTFN